MSRPLPVIIDEFDRRHNLVIILHSLAYADRVEHPVPRYDQGNLETWLDEVTAWLLEYQKTISVAKTSAAEMAAELRQLRDERAAVRSFFGTTERTS